MTDLMKIITEAKENGYRAFGVRTGDKVEIGQEVECSHDWDLENDCSSDELLDGTCATGIYITWWDGEEEDDEILNDAIAYNAKHYSGEMQYIIAGTGYENGYDDGEAIIYNAVVIAIIK